MQVEHYVPLEKLTISVQDNGIWKDMPAIDKSWVAERAFPRFIAPPACDNTTSPVGAQDSWQELVQLLYEDLSWLLKLPHHSFWSQVIFSKAPVAALTSFLQENPPAYCGSSFPRHLEEVNRDLSKIVFLVFCRLSTTKESTEHFITPNCHGDILYDNYIFTVPSMLDLCALYGASNRSEVERILRDVTSLQPKYLDDFSMAEPHLIRVFENADSMLAGDKKNPKEVRDLILHVYDSVFTMRAFVEILPAGCEIFSTPHFLSSIASFYTSVMPKVAKNSEIKVLVDNLRIECLLIVRTILQSVLTKAIESKSSKIVENYLTLVSEIMSEGLFVCDYHSCHPIDVDFDIVTGLCPDIDMVKLDYLTEALASHVDLKLRKKEEPRPPESNILNYPTTSALGSSRPQRLIGGVKLMSLITEVQDILPHLGAGFVEACLKYYDYSTEAVVSAVLESSLPPNIEELKWDMEQPPLPVPERANVFDYDEFDVNTSNHIDKSRVYRGKKPREHKNLNQMLGDKKAISEMRDKFAHLGFVEDEYDDEYDDTYESEDVSVREPDEAERRRVFVVPRVLRVREVEDEDEDEEEEKNGTDEAPKRDIFVQNPEEVRAKAEQRRAQMRGQKDVVGRAKGQGQDKQVIINRDKKNVQKASSGNHHRRDRASKKRNQGMIPS